MGYDYKCTCKSTAVILRLNYVLSFSDNAIMQVVEIVEIIPRMKKKRFPFVLNGQYYGYWRPGDEKNQCSNSI